MIRISKIHDLKGFVSQERTRYALTAVHVDEKNGVIEATDGKKYISVPLLGDSDGKFPITPGQGDELKKNMLIPYQAIEKALKNTPTKSIRPILNSALLTNKDGKGVLSMTDLENGQDISFAPAVGNFPKTSDLFTKEKPKAEFILSADMLESMVAYAKKNGKKSEGNPINFKFYGDNIGLKFEIDVGQKKPAIGVVMPMAK